MSRTTPAQIMSDMPYVELHLLLFLLSFEGLFANKPHWDCRSATPARTGETGATTPPSSALPRDTYKAKTRSMCQSARGSSMQGGFWKRFQRDCIAAAR